MELTAELPFLGKLQKRMLASFRKDVEEWAGFVRALTEWEDEHLFDNPTSEDLDAHKSAVERFLTFGSDLELAIKSGQFADQRLAEMVEATQALLRDKLRLFHGPRMSRERADKIIAEVFPE